MQSITTIRNGTTRWFVRSDVAEPFRDLIVDIQSELEARTSITILKENLARTVYRLPFPTDGGDEIILKDYRVRGWDQTLRYMIRPSKARAEWRAMSRLRGREFPTATPIGYSESRSRGVLTGCSFASVAIPGAYPFPDRFRTGEAAEREALIGSLANLVVALHGRGAYHRDLHVGNVLVSGDRLFLIDLHRAAFPPRLTRRMRLRDLTKICHSLTFITDEGDLRRLVHSYAEATGLAGGADTAFKKIRRGVSRMERVRIRSRSLRCVKESTGFRRATLPKGVLYHRRRWPEDLLRAAMVSHQEAAAGGDRLLKASERAQVTRVSTPQGEIACKEYLYPRWSHLLENLLRTSPARRAYIAGRGLEELRIPTPEVIGLYEERSLGVVTRSLLFSRFVDGEPVEIAFKRFNDPERRDALSPERRVFLREFADAVRRIHDSDVYQPDMAGQNFLVVEKDGERTFFLVDLDRVRLGERITDLRRRRSLSQIGHMPGTLTRGDRLHFLRAYAGSDEPFAARETLRLLAEMIDQKAIDQEKRIARILRKQSGA